MRPFWNFLFAIGLLLIWIIAGGYITQASVFLIPSKNIDKNFKNAYKYSTWAAVVTWLLVAFAIVGVILLFVFGAEIAAAAASAAEAATSGGAITSIQNLQKASKGVSWIVLGFLGFALALVFLTGILSALTATNIKSSEKYDPKNKKMARAYKDSIIAASLSLGAAGLLIIGSLTYIVVKGQQKRNAIRKQQELGLTQSGSKINMETYQQMASLASKTNLKSIPFIK